MTKETKKLLSLIDKKEKMVAMLAPSFPVDFDYPKIIGELKGLGFDKVVEVSAGAIETNKQLKALLKLRPNRKYISNACPGIVYWIKNQYPELANDLTPIDTPMIATAKIAQEKYPEHKKVFIGPCLMKKKEAQDSDLDILVLTYKEISEVLEKKEVEVKEGNYSFDLVGSKTRLYPISGGLGQSSGLIQKMTDAEIDVISGDKIKKAIEDFIHNPEIKVLDILSCDGGCINGPGIMSQDSLEERRKKVIGHWVND